MQLIHLASLLLFSTSTLAAPTQPLESRADTTTKTIYPTLQFRWRSVDGDKFAPNTATGHLLNMPNEKVHTAIGFEVTDRSIVGKKCKLVFRLSNDDWVVSPTPSAPAPFDIFRLWGTVNDKYSWNYHPERAAPVGTLLAKKGAVAQWQSASVPPVTPSILPPGSSSEWPCETADYAFELVAHPALNIGWTNGRGSGLAIEVSDY